jgi:heme oxygenase
MPDSAALRQDDLLAAMRAGTRALHVEAERSGFVHDLLKGHATRAGYALWLRNLHPVYATMERGLDGLSGTPSFAGLAMPPVYRAAAIASDLAAVCGPAWFTQVPSLDAGAAYAARLAAVSGDPLRLAAHAYVRYLGDLNGGLVVGRLVARSLGLGTEALAFYTFSADTTVLERAYRQALAQAGEAPGDVAAAVEEAVLAFRHNIALSEAVRDAA